MALSIDDVWRDYNTRGVPASGDRKPVKSEIRRLMKQILGGTAAVGDYQGAWSGATAYITSDYVEYGGSLWIADRNNTGVTPVEGADWSLLLPGVTVADATVTTAKLSNGAVTRGKIDSGMEALITAMLADVFVKANPYGPVFKVKSGSGGQQLQIKAGTKVEVDNTIVSFDVDTDVTLPALTAGRDYAVWVRPNGVVQAVDWTDNSRELAEPFYPSPPAASSRMIGGFHYARGGNATNYNTGGNTTAQISPYSIWDDKFRPDCLDPRGMVLVGEKFWCDIYLLNTQHSTLGTSRNNVAIAHGTVNPLIPAFRGGNGSSTYDNLYWWSAVDIMSAHGKELLSYAEFMLAAHGVVEEKTRSSLHVTTGLGTSNSSAAADAEYTSQWGVINATGAHWVWGRELSYGIFQGGYNEPPDGSSVTSLSVVPEYIDPGIGRGWLVQENLYATRALLFGSKSNNLSRGGSICLDLANGINTTSASISARGRANHRVTV